MKHPPLLQSIYVVMILAVANLGAKGSTIDGLSNGRQVAVTIALIAAGLIVAPLVTSRRAPPEEAPQQAQDDFDLSA